MDEPVVDVFLSYRRVDTESDALRIVEHLREELPALQVFHDSEISGGERWNERLQQALAQSRTVIVLMGPKYVDELKRRAARQPPEPDVVEQEVAKALALQKTLLPLVVGLRDMPARTDLPPSIQGLLQFDAIFMPPTGFGIAMDSLRGSLRRLHGLRGDEAGPRAEAQAAAPAQRLLAGLGRLAWLALALALAAFVGEVVAWRCADLGPWPQVRRLWLGALYLMGTAMFGAAPYLACVLVTQVRIRVGLPPWNRQGVISMLGLVLMLLAGSGFLLLSTLRGWALDPLLPQALFPNTGAGVMHYLLLAGGLLGIAVAALMLALLEPRFRSRYIERRRHELLLFDALALLQLAGMLWFIASLLASLPPLPQPLVVPVVGYASLAPALSLLLALRLLERHYLGERRRQPQLHALFGLIGGLWLLCTLALFCDGPVRWLLPAFPV